MEQADDFKNKGGRGHWMKEGEGMSQRTYMHDPWTWAMICELPEGVPGWRWAKGEKVGTTVVA